MPRFQTDYGYFSDDGKEYVITRPDTPRPAAGATQQVEVVIA